ncbi:MAG: hypothetical protein AAGK09_10775 [Planctomycetota bacterium]
MTTLPHDAVAVAEEHLHRFLKDRYFLRRKVLKLFGGAFHIRDASGDLVLYSKQKSFRIREDISLFDNEAMTTQLIRITTQSVFDIAGTYAVQDMVTGETIGGLKRHGLSSSFIRDKWEIYDPDGRQIGEIVEDSQVKAILRRAVDSVAVLMPQKYHATIGGQTVATYHQNFNPFVYKLEVDFSMDTNNLFDPRLGLAAAVLLAAIEGKQS